MCARRLLRYINLCALAASGLRLTSRLAPRRTRWNAWIEASRVARSNTASQPSDRDCVADRVSSTHQNENWGELVIWSHGLASAPDAAGGFKLPWRVSCCA